MNRLDAFTRALSLTTTLLTVAAGRSAAQIRLARPTAAGLSAGAAPALSAARGVPAVSAQALALPAAGLAAPVLAVAPAAAPSAAAAHFAAAVAAAPAAPAGAAPKAESPAPAAASQAPGNEAAAQSAGTPFDGKGAVTFPLNHAPTMFEVLVGSRHDERLDPPTYGPGSVAARPAPARSMVEDLVESRRRAPAPIEESPEPARIMVEDLLGGPRRAGLSRPDANPQPGAAPRRQDLPKSSRLARKVAALDGEWRDANIMNGVVRALSGRLKSAAPADASLAARSLLEDAFRDSEGRAIGSAVRARIRKTTRKGVESAARGLADGFVYDPRNREDRAAVRRQVESLVASLGKNVIAVSAESTAVIQDIGDEPLRVALVLFVNARTGDYVAFYARQGNG